MPKNKDLKRRVRSRMDKTGESYTTARQQVAQKKTPVALPIPKGLADIAGMSDDAVEAKTNRTWREWVRVLDGVDAASWPHPEIAKHLLEVHGLGSWWAQMVTVGYERIRGLRQKNQRREGTFDVNKSKTLPVAITTLFRAFRQHLGGVGLGDLKISVRKATPSKSLRLSAGPGRPIAVHFWEKGARKSQVQIQHQKLSSVEEADRVRALWTSFLESLAQSFAEE